MSLAARRRPIAVPPWLADDLADRGEDVFHPAYRLAQALCRRADLTLLDDNRTLAKIAGLSTAAFLRLRAKIADLIEVTGQRLTLRPLRREMARYEMARATGAKGGRATVLRRLAAVIAPTDPEARQRHDERLALELALAAETEEAARAALVAYYRESGRPPPADPNRPRPAPNRDAQAWTFGRVRVRLESAAAWLARPDLVPAAIRERTRELLQRQEEGRAGFVDFAAALLLTSPGFELYLRIRERPPPDAAAA